MPEKRQEIDLGALNLARLGHNYLMQVTKGAYSIEEINRMNAFINYISNPTSRDLKTYKVGVMFVCINQPYWQYAEPVIAGIKNLFLPGHNTEIMCWTDLENYTTIVPKTDDEKAAVAEVNTLYAKLKKDATLFTVDSVGWPYPTLMRYHLFLQQEEYLKQFDYLFYVDLDMRIVGIVGDEILGDGLTMAQHPMYALRQEFWLPYEANPESAAHIKTPGRIMEVNGAKVFQPLYAAGGVQGGTQATFLPAMKAMKKSIDADFAKNYVARWNDESHWNRYLYDHPPAVVLDPSYVYPDSMIEEYYKKLWGRDYPAKIVTLTKPFTVSSEGGAAARKMVETL